MLAVRRKPNLDLGLSYPIGSCWDVRWVRIDDPTAASTSCFEQGFAKGGARFSRLEGAWWGDRTGFFLSTNGGTVGEGQVFEYDPREETVKLIYDAPNAERSGQPRQHDRDAARRTAAVRRRRRQQLHGGRASRSGSRCTDRRSPLR